uniref:Protein FMC1 homolog n=1 Tax=Mesocestoides corti TaxID=53468 RepID=A0A5K3F2J0_MESCO
MSHIGLLHSLLKELQRTCRHPKLTSEQQCAAKHEGLQLARTYLTLLKNVSNHRHLVASYRCRQKTTSETANLVGLSPPQAYSG